MRRGGTSAATTRRDRITGAAAGLLLMVLPALLTLGGCGSSAPAPAPPPAAADSAAVKVPKAAMTLRVASLDVSGFRGRIEMKEVGELAGLVSSMKIDVIALQGITRYPGVATRTDLVDALASATGMRSSFGENLSVSGRQTGNAVLSAYPIESSDNRPFRGISGSGFEGALEAIIDAGTRTVVVVSTRLPDAPGAKDLGICTATLNGIAADHPNDPLIVLGNLPAPPGGGTWEGIEASPGNSWFTRSGISPRADRGGRCALGTLRVAEVDVFPHGKP